MRCRASSYCQLEDRRQFLTPNSPSAYTLSKKESPSSQASTNLTSSLTTLPHAGCHVGRPLIKGNTVCNASPHRGMDSQPCRLDRRHGRSCDLHATDNDEDKSFDNPIAQVSSDILRVSGYTQQFRSLLTARFSPRRDSTPDVTVSLERVPTGAEPTVPPPRRRRSEINPYHLNTSTSIGRRARLSIAGRGAYHVEEPQPLPANTWTQRTRKSIKKRADDFLNRLVRSPSEYERYVNGGVRFESDVDGEPKSRGSNAVRVIRRRQSGYGISISSESTAKMRFRQRKVLFVRRNRVCDLSLILAIAGIVFIIIDSELTALSATTGVTKDHWLSLGLRGLCVLTTVLLMACLVHYHSIEVKLALIDSGAEDWRVALNMDRVVKLSVELFACAICPFPYSSSIRWPYIKADTRQVNMIEVPVDVLLSVPMFVRSYLLCRFMVLHSKQFQDAATRSIAALNRISMDFRFVIKTMMADHPLRVLIVFTVSYWVCMSWMFTQCERYDGQLEVEHYYLNSMWFIMVTFMSIGYGDIVPNTYCGRALSIITGIVGAGVSSALIAVISRKLELSRAEKHVNNFMADSKLTNQRKNAAASVLQQTWFIHKYKKGLNKGDDLRLRHHQRRFLHSINEFRRIKWDQRKLQEKGNSLLDVGKLHSDMHETLWEMHRTQDHFISQIDMLTQKIIELQTTLVTQLKQQQPSTPQLGTTQCNGSAVTVSASPTPPVVLPPPPTSYSQPQLEPHLTASSSVPRINIGSNGSAVSAMKNTTAPKEITPGHFITAATPLMSSFEEV